MPNVLPIGDYDMPDDIFADEEYGKKLYKRYKTIWLSIYFVSVTLFCILAFFVYVNFTLWTILMIGAVALLDRLITRHFAKKMSAKDKDALEKYAQSSLRRPNKANLYKILAEYEKANRTVSAKKHFLRASQQTQNDTFLRAAAYTDNTPQEQLLRPANDDESH